MVISVICRVMEKTVVDFTGMLQVRHPNNLGGEYWLFSMVYTQVSVFVVLWLSWDLEEWKEEALAIGKDDILVGAVGLSCLWVVAMGTLLLFGERKYVHTFYGRMTGRAYAMKEFVDGDDLTRMGIVTGVHRAHWSEIEEEVEDWLGLRWEEWHSSKPDWFSEELIRRIPRDLIPHMHHASVREEGGEEVVNYERRMSMGDSLKRVVRETLGVGQVSNGGKDVMTVAEEVAKEMAALTK